MIKYYLLFSSVIIVNSTKSFGQETFDFTNDPLSESWNYEDAFNSSPYGEFSFDAVNERIDYSISSTTQKSFLHTPLANSLGRNYCVEFEITPTNSNNYNTFFPLILTPSELTEADNHPWRLNAVSSNVAGGMQNIDFIAIEVFSNEIRFFNRDNDQYTSSTISSLSPNVHMQVNTTYYVSIEVVDFVNVSVNVYSDAQHLNVLGSLEITIPLLDNMSHLYIANSNGNSSCTQEGYLDNYRLGDCDKFVGIEDVEIQPVEKKVVKVYNLLGQEVPLQNDEKIYFIQYEDGTTRKFYNNK